MEPDFSGYVTKYGLRCSDGRTILAHAFQGQDGQQIPLVWQHQHNSPDNVLGHLILQHRQDGVYGYGFFNDTPPALQAKALVQHKDLNGLSIYANQLIQSGMNVSGGNIREGSLVLAGANPGALIDNVYIQHGESVIAAEGEVIIYTGDELVHGSGSAPSVPVKPALVPAAPVAALPAVPSVVPAAVQHAVAGLANAAPAPQTVTDLFDTLTEEQQNLVYALIGEALNHAAGSSPDLSMTATDQKGDMPVTRNVFDQNGGPVQTGPAVVLSHADVQGIVADAIKGGSLKEAVQSYALAHGIENIGAMFPEVRLLENQPDFQKRRTEWVAGVLGATRKSPFARVKTLLADITQDQARAKGYITGSLKQEEFFGVTRRTTTPTTIYKKQKLDRDDVVDITDFDVVAWLQGEMRLMLDEELARCILIGDGRQISDQDKVKDPVGASDGAGIRSILNDHEVYVTTLNVNLADANSTPDEIVDAVVNGMRFYRGTGMPVFYTTQIYLSKLLLTKDSLGRRLYDNKADLATKMLVSDIVPCEAMEEETDLVGIVVNLQDYNIGADRGGEVNLFDFFDIDFNQNKYLIETRLSGALVKFKSALVIKTTAGTNVLVDPITAPTFDETTGIVTIPTQTGVTYKNNDTQATLSAGAQTALAPGATLNVIAIANSGYYFASNAEDQWSFTRPA